MRQEISFSAFMLLMFLITKGDLNLYFGFLFNSRSILLLFSTYIGLFIHICKSSSQVCWSTYLFVFNLDCFSIQSIYCPFRGLISKFLSWKNPPRNSTIKELCVLSKVVFTNLVFHIQDLSTSCSIFSCLINLLSQFY